MSEDQALEFDVAEQLAPRIGDIDFVKGFGILAILADVARRLRRRPFRTDGNIVGGHQASDTFFQHGGAFSSTYVNKIFFPSSGPLSLNIEHSHDTDYVIQVQYQLPSIGAPVPSPITQVQGTLTGTDDISISGGTLTTLTPLGFASPFVVTIQLTDKVTAASTSAVFGYVRADTKAREP